MNYYVVPVIIALFVKIAVLVIANRSGIRTQYLYAFVGTFALHNLCELLLFLNGNHFGADSDFLLRTYYAVTFILVGFACSCALEVANVEKGHLTKLIEQYVWLGAIAGAILSLITDQIVTGATPLSYTITAVKGEAYWLFQVTSTIALVTGAYGLIREIMITHNPLQKVRCKRMLVAYLPVVVGAIGVLFLMKYGFQVNATMVLPITSTFFLGFLIYSEREHRLTDVRHIIPGTHEHAIMDELHSVFSDYSADEIGYKEARKRIDSLLVTYAWDKHQGNASQAADFMGIPRSSLYSSMDRLDIPRKRGSELDA